MDEQADPAAEHNQAVELIFMSQWRALLKGAKPLLIDGVAKIPETGDAWEVEILDVPAVFTVLRRLPDDEDGRWQVVAETDRASVERLAAMWPADA